MEKLLKWTKIIVSVCGGWWSAMSGAFSIPLAFAALFIPGEPQILFAVLAFGGVWVFAIGVIIKNHSVEQSHKQAVQQMRIAHAEEIGQINERTIQTTKKQTVKNTLAEFLLRMEDRTRKISKMSAMDFAQSIDESIVEAESKTDLNQFRESIKTLKDIYSIDLAAEIFDYLKVNCGEDKAKLFYSETGMGSSLSIQGRDIASLYSERQNYYVDHLRHWAKNLLEIIKQLD